MDYSVLDELVADFRVTVTTEEQCLRHLKSFQEDLELTPDELNTVKKAEAVLSAVDGMQVEFGPSEILEFNDLADKYKSHQLEFSACALYLVSNINYDELNSNFEAYGIAEQALMYADPIILPESKAPTDDVVFKLIDPLGIHGDSSDGEELEVGEEEDDEWSRAPAESRPEDVISLAQIKEVTGGDTHFVRPLDCVPAPVDEESSSDKEDSLDSALDMYGWDIQPSMENLNLVMDAFHDEEDSGDYPTSGMIERLVGKNSGITPGLVRFMNRNRGK